MSMGLLDEKEIAEAVQADLVLDYYKDQQTRFLLDQFLLQVRKFSS